MKTLPISCWPNPDDTVNPISRMSVGQQSTWNMKSGFCSVTLSADLSYHAFYLSHPLILPLYQTVSLQLGPLWPWLSSRFSSMCCSIGGREVRCGWTAALSLWAQRVTDWVGRSDDPPPCPTKVKPPRLYSTDTVGDFTDSDYSELSKIQRLLEWRENSLE